MLTEMRPSVSGVLLRSQKIDEVRLLLTAECRAATRYYRQLMLSISFFRKGTFVTGKGDLCCGFR